MTRANITIAILAILIVALCVLCYIGKPLFKSEYVPAIGTLAKNIDETRIGREILTHYVRQLHILIIYGAEPYKELTNQDAEKITIFLMKCLFAGLVALVGVLAGAALFVVNSGQQPSISKFKMILAVAMIILAGTIIRLILASAVYGNTDMQAYAADVDIIGKGGNIYAETSKYNYSPVWFMILFALKRIQLAILDVPFHFVVRSFLCCVDLLTLLVLLLIAGIRKLSMVRTAIFFYLSPVSFLVTGYHGQFENLAILMLLIGIYIYLRLATRPVLRTALLWFFATAGMIVKHNIFYELIICLNSSIKRYWIKLSLFVISVGIFLSLFIPYWSTGSKGIIENVFGYGSGFGAYGLTYVLKLPSLKYLFILAMFVFPLFLKSKDIIAQCLLGALFFLTFTTGIAIQYFVLPVAIGALRPSKICLLYTFLATLFILGSVNNVYIPGFELFQWNVVWIGAVCWFIAEMRLDRQANEIISGNHGYQVTSAKK